MKFKVGQQVYFYLSTGEYHGRIMKGTISKAIKDLSIGKITYTVILSENCCGWHFNDSRELTADYLYSSLKTIEKEYKEEIVYNNLHEKIDELQETLNKVYNELTKEEHKGWKGMTLDITGEKAFSSIYVKADDVNIEGIGSLKEEISKLKKEVSKIKKQIKSKTKKPVVEKKEDTKNN